MRPPVLRLLVSAGLAAAAALAVAASTSCTALAQEGGNPPAAPVPAPAPVPASDDFSPAARAERLARAKERWARMTPEQQERVRRSYAEWQKLPADRREILRRRLDDMGGPEDANLMHRRLTDLRRKSPEQVVRMRMQARTLQQLEKRLVDGLPESAREKYEQLTPRERERARIRLARALLEIGRDQMVLRYGTDEERSAIREGTPEARREACRSIFKRSENEILGPHREELKNVKDDDQRRILKARYLGDAFWDGVRAKAPEIRAAFQQALAPQEAGPGPRRPFHLARETVPMMRDRFVRAFGVAADQLGDTSIARTLIRAASFQPDKRRDEFLAELRPGIREIVDTVPLADRPARIRALLDRLAAK